jgi:hypothetical protein
VTCSNLKNIVIGYRDWHQQVLLVLLLLESPGAPDPSISVLRRQTENSVLHVARGAGLDVGVLDPSTAVTGV